MCYLIVGQLVYLLTTCGCAKKELQPINWSTPLKFIILREVWIEEEAVRRTPTSPMTPNDSPNFLQNPATSCDTLQFSAIIYTKVALSHTTDGPLSMCHILSTLITPSPIPFLCCSIAIPLHFCTISLTISNVIYIPYSSPISLLWSTVGC